MKQYKKLFAVLTLLCFALTLMPIAAFADSIDYQQCSVFTEDTSVKTGKNVAIKFDFDGQLSKGVTTPDVYVWFVKDGSDIAALAVNASDSFIEKNAEYGIFKIPANKVIEGKEYNFLFENAGNYTVAAAFSDPATVKGTTNEKFKNVEKKLISLSGQKTFEITSSSDSDLYQLQLVDDAGLPWSIKEGDKIINNGQATIGEGIYAFSSVNNFLATNGVASEDITFKLLDKDGKAVKGATVKLSTSNTNCIVNKDTVVTDQLGQFKFNIALTEESPHTDGFTIYIECGSYEGQLKIMAASTGA